ncbi:uncharacterized protein [Miscanthus floridulus]|uniref:uncharacterized protein n=1 Tax=Miscanthus floridulus TaxID=154761 RepID=UPI00345B30D7
MGVPIHQINFPRSPSPIPGFPSSGMPVYSAPTSHMSTTAPHARAPYSGQAYEGAPPEFEGFAVPKYHKLTFNIFDGKDDPLGWLNKCDQFFRGQMTQEVDKVWLASYHLTGVALQWYIVLEADMGRPTWPDFRRLCQQRFGPALGTNHLTDLARLPFGASVDAYMEAF